MGKLILLVLGAFIVYWLLKSYGRGIQNAQPPKPKEEGPEDMVRCAHCGVHLPKSESILSRGAFYCSDEHRKLHQK